MREHIILRELTARALNLTLALYRVTDLLPQEEPLRRGIREKGGEIFAAVISARHSDDLKLKKGDVDHAWVATEILLGYLAMARTLGCANPLNFLVLEREYRSLRDDISVEETSLKDSVRESSKGQTEKKSQPERKKNESVSPIKSNPSSIPLSRTSAGVDSNGVKAPPSWTGVSESMPPRPAKTGSANDRQKAIIGHLSDKGQAKISDFYETFDGVSSKTIQRDLQDLVARNVIRKEGDKRWTIYTLV